MTIQSVPLSSLEPSRANPRGRFDKASIEGLAMSIGTDGLLHNLVVKPVKGKAELGSAFLCADLELDLAPREDHSAYIASWLKVLKNDKRAIFTAAAHAQRAVDFLHGLQPDTATAGEAA